MAALACSRRAVPLPRRRSSALAAGALWLALLCAERHAWVADAGGAEGGCVADDPTALLPSSKFGFYLHVYMQPAAVIFQVETIRRVFPDSPIYIMSDGGDDFSGLCAKYNCTFVGCPPANDRWNPWPFLRRMWDAAMALKTEYTVMLEPDNTIHRGFLFEPPLDAGGLEDANPHLHGETVEYAEMLGKRRHKAFTWNYTGSGLAGGSYFRTQAILDAFSDAAVSDIDWEAVECFESKRVFSSDFAMPVVLAARGYRYEPWRDITQYDLDCCTKVRQPRAAALEHYGRGYTGGKPTYNIKLKPGDEALYKQVNWQPRVVCQGCYDRDEYYQRWGTLNCTNRLYKQSPSARKGGAGTRWCNAEERQKAQDKLIEMLGGRDKVNKLRADRRRWEEDNLKERLTYAAKVDQRLEAYMSATRTTWPPTHPGSPRMPGLPELPKLPPPPPPTPCS